MEYHFNTSVMIYRSKRLLIPFVVGLVIYIILITKNSREKLKDIIKCNNKNYEFEVDQRGSFWILKNFIKAEHGSLKCYESITYTTTADIRCIENIKFIAERFVVKSTYNTQKKMKSTFRWKAPISFALYSPKHLYNNSLNSISYLRNCLPQSSFIRKYVTFHLFFPLSDRPDFLWKSETFNCKDDPPYANFKRYVKNNDTFPINVGRNIASLAALTHFQLKSDSELFPSENVVSKFFDFIVDNKDIVTNKGVFIIPAFEVPSDVSNIPYTLFELKDLLIKKKAIFFFDIPTFCNWCFQFPNKELWISKMLASDHLRIHHKTKRLMEFKSIEHFYIGTEYDPLYPEELTWNMQNDKMAHEYAMCLLDYDYYFLTGAFLVHSPGYHSRKLKNLLNFNNLSWNVFDKQLKPTYDLIYGGREGCVLR